MAVPIDISEFLAGLHAATPEELGFVVAAAAHWRNVLRSQSGWDLEFPDAVVADDRNAIEKLSPLLARLNEERTPETELLAAGLMVWLHTLNAFETPAKFSGGQELWIELKRGMPYAFHAALRLEQLYGRRLDLKGADRIPHNLIPSDDEEDVA